MFVVVFIVSVAAAAAAPTADGGNIMKIPSGEGPGTADRDIFLSTVQTIFLLGILIIRGIIYPKALIFISVLILTAVLVVFIVCVFVYLIQKRKRQRKGRFNLSDPASTDENELFKLQTFLHYLPEIE
ncbi:hypothetical protein EXN66_Car013914 [Channa argus]|uniref:Uncharacterized protein n=1 Tax=Channa argus TaxID=215402 RepID=A0A6G1Q7B4_CHAAH|nr:hypothetical protein EXN66_Car013914 [Channa argus]